MNGLELLEIEIQKQFKKKEKWLNSRNPTKDEYQTRIKNQVYGKLVQMDWTLKRIRFLKKEGAKGK